MRSDKIKPSKIQRVWGLVSITLLTACASNDVDSRRRPADLVPIDSIQIQAKFATTDLTAQTLSAAVRPCLPWLLSANGPGLAKLTSKIEDSKKLVVVYGDTRSGNRFVMTNSLGFCIQRSSANLPILAAEAIEDTANPIGVPTAVRESWNAQIARRLAVVGQTKVAYPQSNGNAYVVNFWMDNEEPRLKLKYKSEFKRRGEWEKDVYDLQFTHPLMSTFLIVERGPERGKLEQIKPDLLDHRYKPFSPSTIPNRR